MAGKSGGGGNVVGYRYFLGMLMGLCRGPVNGLTHIKVGDLEAWSDIFDGVNNNSTIDIDAPGLFGGEEKEGGIVGPLETYFGDPEQSVASSGFVATVGAAVSDLRGVFTVFFNGLIAVNNPYPKPWSFRVWRTDAGWPNNSPWYPDESLIELADSQGNKIRAMNPAHIIYECLTNPVWGRGLNPAAIDEDSFISAANYLCREEFGLCIAWTRSEDLGQFIGRVFNHIGAVMYPDRTTGLLVLRLLRNDYDADALPVFDYSTGLLSVQDDESTAPDNSHSEIVVNWTDPVTDNQRQTRVQNLAGTRASQTVVSTKVDYLGVPTAELASRLAQRDLALQAPGIKRFTLKFDRRGRKINPGTVFKVTIPDRDIANMILRAGTVTEGSILDQSITVVAVQDVFSLERTTYLSEPDRTWQPPDRSLRTVDDFKIAELNYRDQVRILTAAHLATVATDSGDPVVVAKAPSALSVHYELMTHATGEGYADKGSFGWCPSASLAANIGIYDTTMTIASGYLLGSLPALPITAWIEDEIVEVTSYDTGTGVMGIVRGCVDTLPVGHDVGVRIWFAENGQGADGREYTTGETVSLKFLTRTSTGILDIALADENTFTVVGRQGLPYPPGNLYIDGTRFGDVGTVIGDIAFTWAHRDRITQADHILGHTEASTGPETDTTYQVDIYHGATLLRSTTGITADNWTYTTSMATADGSPSKITAKLRSERDGYLSFQEYAWPIYRVATGYGRGYGLSYGKAA